MKKAFKAFAMISMLSVATAAMAADATTKPARRGAAAAGLRGRVEKVDGTKITITSRDGEKVIDTDDSTKFTMDGAAATLADIKPDERITVSPETGVATEVRITVATQRRRRDKDGSKEPTTAPAGNTTVAPSDAK